MRLTVVTTFGLIGTVATGVLGMNLFSHSEESGALKLAIFLTVFVPTVLLTFYTVAKLRRLSEFLDALSDEKISWSMRLPCWRFGGGDRAAEFERSGVMRRRPLWRGHKRRRWRQGLSKRCYGNRGAGAVARSGQCG